MNDSETHAGLFAGPAHDPDPGQPAEASGVRSDAELAPAAAPAEPDGSAAMDAPAVQQDAVPPALGFGAMLRAAREAAGVTVPGLALRMRLHVKQVEALERGDLEALPALIYVRGFLRSCARELGIDPAPLLADLDQRAGVPPGLQPSADRGSLRLSRFGDGSRLLIVAGLALLLVAGLVGIWMPRHNGIGPAAPVVLSPPPPTAAPESPAAGGAAPGVAPSPGEADAATGQTPKTLLPPSGAPLPARLPNGPGRGPAASNQAVAPDAVAEVAAPVEAPVLATLPPPIDPNALVLSVHATSWVEVAQSNGTTIFSQICLAGSEHTIRGVPPLRVVIGNAAAVEARFRGASIDLQPHANANGVARFTLQ
jgi:cytoskeleton protein RodZ